MAEERERERELHSTYVLLLFVYMGFADNFIVTIQLKACVSNQFFRTFPFRKRFNFRK